MGGSLRTSEGRRRDEHKKKEEEDKSVDGGWFVVGVVVVRFWSTPFASHEELLPREEMSL